ncbi:Membrane carboxypeptidase (penicillin-binding protein) [Variovorax sp. CF079]|uniref:transglycosylase domain-containing protein n=1 Tax=Variovorax sp. CF079 TaxID=1882774 RepID=UPI00088389F5|nr:transglycosylase domain-containing protein [Variovorax sp. CF079]SDD96105.1 Membrane carboxypeptidase (penicillin-binding protein) [Variovorax sp. CF079]
MLTNPRYGLIARQSVARFRTVFWLGAALAGVAALVAFAVDELKTSRLQSALWHDYARDARFSVDAGASAAIRFPHSGPYDERLGYRQLPNYIERLQAQGYVLTRQARMSPRLIELHERGLFGPYREKNQAGLTVSDCRAQTLLRTRVPQRVYERFEEVPPLLVNALLFVEDRHLLDAQPPQRNPAIDPERFAKAALEQMHRALDVTRPASGGSTLATQIEKYRHSPGGRTASVGDKLRQMASASLRAYQDGDDTLARRRQIVVDYLDTVPLAARPGFGEVHGLGDGLWTWYGREFGEVNRLLADTGGETAPSDEALRRQAVAFKQALSLMIAQRRPSQHLLGNGEGLTGLTDSYLRLMGDAGIIAPALRDAALAVPLQQQAELPAAPRPDFVQRKAVNALRTHVSTLLDVPRAYDLERLDLEAETSLDNEAQALAIHALTRLRTPAAAKSAGLIGDHRLDPGANLSPLIYSFTLYERGAHANLLRVQADNIDQPFDVNQGARLDLGSTAKLRTLVSYLELVAELHERWVGLDAPALSALKPSDRDPLGTWARQYLLRAKDRSLAPMLEAAMQRRYSASEGEAFFTGGGLHRFENFDRTHAAASMTVQEAFNHSVNLVFIRLMRDIVYHRMFGEATDGQRLLQDPADPRRREMLARFADNEGSAYLARFHRKYKGKSAAEAEALLLRGVRPSAPRLASVLFTIEPEAGDAQLDELLARKLGRGAGSPRALRALRNTYAGLSLADRGYVARVHPLELWLVGFLRQQPHATLAQALDASARERQEVYAWLFKTRHKSAQDRRIRELLERDAFAQVHRSWQRLGYPFASLTPSYASAIGASGDRPAALAELMGILVNDGARRPVQRVGALHFARDTPYESRLEQRGPAALQVLPPEVAATARRALFSVVREGTARRLKGALVGADGRAIEIGGKTGTGDHRYELRGRGGQVIAERKIGRSATFVFMIGDRYYGTILAYVREPHAARYRFTSALPVQLLKSFGPQLLPVLQRNGCGDNGRS